MGQRANLLIIESGRGTLYYDHWCANRLDDELFWGPEEALHFIRQRDPIGADGWLDEVWCEGAAVVRHAGEEVGNSAAEAGLCQLHTKVKRRFRRTRAAHAPSADRSRTTAPD
jgi:hypothetical protein